MEIRIDLEGGTEFAPLLVELLMEIFLCISRLYGFLGSVEIMQESRPGGGRESCHDICNWG